jgi:predicted transcriptional regulator
MSLRDLIQDAVEEGEGEAKERGAFFAYWWEYFSLNCNPFDTHPINPLINEKESALFVDRLEELKQLANLIGKAKFARNRMKVVVVGPSGIGKRSLAYTLFWGIEKAEEKGFIFNVGKNSYTYPEMESQSQLLPDSDEIQFVILENMAEMERARMRFKSYDHRRILIIAFWAPEYITDDLDFDLRIPLSPLKEEMIEEILVRRIEKCGGNPRIIAKEVLRDIARYSKGIPLLALDLASEVLLECYRRRGEQASLTDLESSVERCHYTFSGHEFRKSDLRVLKYLARVETTTPAALAKEISMSRVMAWKYLDRYFNEGLVTRESRGKSYEYHLTTPGKASIQLALMGRRNS